MSTYLLAIAITDFEYVEMTYRDIKLRIWAQPKILNDTRIALNLLPKGLHFYEDYFNISYPLSKLDYYAVQELRVAAMENWGFITIQESSIVHNPAIGSLNSFSNVAMTVLHELAHMWFGNLITMKYWNDLWLNEGFACHMSYKAMRKITPELDVNFIFQYSTFSVQISEEKQKQNPLSSNVTVNQDIYLAFNKINYNKGAAVIHMFEAVVGEDVFRLSLQSFIKHHFYDNAISDDFARSIGRTMKHLNSSNPFGHLGVVGALKSWTRKPGFPQLTVKRINKTTVEISQQPCYIPDIFKTTSHFRYSVPVFYKTTINNNNTALAIINNNETLRINDLALIDPYANCYCKILYDDQTWLRIAKQLQENHTLIPIESRARLILESNGFVTMEKLNITICFELGKYIKNEIEPGPIQTFLLHMDSYQYIFFGNETKGLLRKYISSLLIPIFERVISNEGQKINEQVKRLTILKLCLLNYQPCIDYAKNIFSQVVKDCKNSLLSNPSCNKVDVGYRLAATQDYDLAKRVIEYHIENATHMSQLCVYYYYANTLKQLRPYLMKNLEYVIKKTKGTKFLAMCAHAIYRFPQKDNLVKEVKEFEAANKNVIKAGGPFVSGAIAGRKKHNAQDLKVQKSCAQTLNSFLYEYVSTLSS
uniref:Aminopeptidase n=1 Tax=Panagrolaimus sp. PS1159 TaxID=55785 RepID=A0AC35FKP1_9BILA